MIPVFLTAKHMLDPIARRTPVNVELEVVAASEPTAVTTIVMMRKRISKLKFILPMTVMRVVVTRGSDILIMWVREAEVMPRLELVIREP